MRFALPMLTAMLLAVSATVVHADDLKAPFVGCPSDGQMGSQLVPAGKARGMSVSFKLPGAIAFYQADSGIGVFAPVGWHCYSVNGSDGATIIVSPQAVPKPGIPSEPLDAPVVTLSTIFGGTSGRFTAARYGWELFPDLTKDFVKRVENEGLDPKSDIEIPKSPNDYLRYLTPDLVTFETPAGMEGLGTSPFVKAGLTSISGLVALDESGDMDITILRMSLGKQADAWSRVLVMLNTACVTGNAVCQGNGER